MNYRKSTREFQGYVRNYFGLFLLGGGSTGLSFYMFFYLLLLVHNILF